MNLLFREPAGLFWSRSSREKEDMALRHLAFLKVRISREAAEAARCRLSRDLTGTLPRDTNESRPNPHLLESQHGGG